MEASLRSKQEIDTVSANMPLINSQMNLSQLFRYAKLAVLTLIVFPTACSQGINWREVNVGDLGVSIWIPCSPSTAAREIPLEIDAVARAVVVNMVGCEKDGVQFAVSNIEMESILKSGNPQGGSVDKELKKWMHLWELASLRSLGVEQQIDMQDWIGINGVLNPKAQSIEVKNTSGVTAKFIWFGYKNTLYQIALYSTVPIDQKKEMVSMFTSSVQIK